MRPRWVSNPGLTDRLIVGRNVTLTLFTWLPLSFVPLFRVSAVMSQNVICTKTTKWKHRDCHVHVRICLMHESSPILLNGCRFDLVLVGLQWKLSKKLNFGSKWSLHGTQIQPIHRTEPWDITYSIDLNKICSFMRFEAFKAMKVVVFWYMTP
jgi:hypothetical protein